MSSKTVSAALVCTIFAAGVCSADESAKSQAGMRTASGVRVPTMATAKDDAEGKGAPQFQQSYSVGYALALAYNPETGMVQRFDAPKPGVKVALVYNQSQKRMQEKVASGEGVNITGVYDPIKKEVKFFQSTQKSEEGVPHGIAAVYNPKTKKIEKKESAAPGHAIVGYFDKIKEEIVWKESPEKDQIGVLNPFTNKVKWKKTDMAGHDIAGVFVPGMDK